MPDPSFVKYAVVISFGQLVIAALESSPANENVAKENAVSLTSSFSYSDTVSRMESALKSKGFTIFATIDHRAAEQSVALEMPPTTVIIYGNPLASTPMMLAAPDFALELPLKVLVLEGDNGKTYVTLSPSTTLEGRLGLPPGMAERFARAEKLIASAVTAA